MTTVVISDKQAADLILGRLGDTLTKAAKDAGVDLVRLDSGDIRIWHTDGNEAVDIIAALAKAAER